MPSINIEVQLSSEQLLKAAEQLSQPVLEEFLSQLVILHTHKKATVGLKNQVQSSFQTVTDIMVDNYNQKMSYQRDIETLTQEEYQALLYLGEQIDKLQAQRIEYMTELAKIHEISLIKLMENLGLE